MTPEVRSRGALALFSALLFCGAKGLVHDIDSDSSSVGQIRETLKNLRTSIRDAGFKASALFNEREEWCNTATAANKKRGDATRLALKHLQTDLKDHEAAVDETQGTIEQLSNDIAAAELLVNQTTQVFSVWQKDKSTISESSLASEKKEHVLKTMVQNRQETVASLKSQLELMQPVLAQLRSRAAETKRRSLDRDASVGSLKKFDLALSTVCLQGNNHSIVGDVARTGVEKSVESALKALELVDNAPNHQSAMKTLGEVGASDISFVQVAEANQDDLDSIFGGDAQTPGITQAPEVTPPDVQGVIDHGVQRRPVALAAKKTAVAKTVRPQIQKLLSELKQKTASTDTAQKEWCESQKASNAIVLSLAQAEVSKSAADINAHAYEETLLTTASKQLDTDTADVNSTASALLKGVAKEKAMIATTAKDQQLATRILTQAIAILTDLESSDLPSKSANGAKTAVLALKSAKAAFQKQNKASIGVRHELDDTAELVTAAAKDSVSALQQERMNVDMSLDNHASERERCADSNRGYEDEVGEAQTYLKKLDDECSPDLSVMTEHERSEEVSALKDAETVLDGQNIHGSQSTHGTRSSHASQGLRGAQVNAHLSPMERAAQEMGVAVDGSE